MDVDDTVYVYRLRFYEKGRLRSCKYISTGPIVLDNEQDFLLFGEWAGQNLDKKITLESITCIQEPNENVKKWIERGNLK